MYKLYKIKCSPRFLSGHLYNSFSFKICITKDNCSSKSYCYKGVPKKKHPHQVLNMLGTPLYSILNSKQRDGESEQTNIHENSTHNFCSLLYL